MTPANENDQAFSPADLAELERLLAADRERTVRRMAALGRDVTSIVETTQLGANDDEHDPEGSTIAFERSQASALLASATTHLNDVDAALATGNAEKGIEIENALMEDNSPYPEVGS